MPRPIFPNVSPVDSSSSINIPCCFKTLRNIKFSCQEFLQYIKRGNVLLLWDPLGYTLLQVSHFLLILGRGSCIWIFPREPCFFFHDCAPGARSYSQCSVHLIFSVQLHLWSFLYFFSMFLGLVFSSCCSRTPFSTAFTVYSRTGAEFHFSEQPSLSLLICPCSFHVEQHSTDTLEWTPLRRGQSLRHSSRRSTQATWWYMLGVLTCCCLGVSELPGHCWAVESQSSSCSAWPWCLKLNSWNTFQPSAADGCSREQKWR